MNINITIPTPVLVSGQTFNVRYRLLPSGSWVDISPKTNAQFTISGLSEGLYELEAAVNLGGSPAVICSPVYQTFEVTEDPACLEDLVVETEIQTDANQTTHWIEINYAIPGTPSPCGYTVMYGLVGSGVVNVIDYPVMPSGPLIIPVTVIGDYSVTIYAKKCNGKLVPCVINAPVSPAPSCIGASLGTAYISLINGQYHIVIPFTQSTPQSTTLLASWQQNGPVLSGVPDPGGTANFNSSGQSSISIPISPNQNVQLDVNGNGYILYHGSIVDRCGDLHLFEAGIAISQAVPQPPVISVMVLNKMSPGGVTINLNVTEQPSGIRITPNSSRALSPFDGWLQVDKKTKVTDNYTISVQLTTLKNPPNRMDITWKRTDGTQITWWQFFNISAPTTITPGGTTVLTGSGTLYIEFYNS